MEEVMTADQPKPESLKGRCSQCEHVRSVSDEMGDSIYCSLEKNKLLCLEVLNKTWSNMKDLENTGFISEGTYKAFSGGIKKDIEFAQDYGVKIAEFEYGRVCFTKKGDTNV